MWKFNGCPRCGRDVFRYQNVSGSWHEMCFWCGYHAELGRMMEAEDVEAEGSLELAEGSARLKD